ncbi:acyl carrier protein [Corynebacterium curieae]|uniref:Acyl carrier protein n=1 Tax=Corynebacterium curieae TaxID=2913500 RepID=A0A9X3MBY5_9CORY|nr:acyl carrier protein [Corynebacterium curieae]MCZ9307949.1 acyl carrier protein [Corynebacterium curieae]
MNSQSSFEKIFETVVGQTPDLDKTFLEQGGDSFSAILLSEQLEKEASLDVSPEMILSDAPLKEFL